MMIIIYQHQSALREAFYRLLHAPLSSMLSLSVIIFALMLPSLSYVVLSNLVALNKYVVRSHQISLFMEIDATSTEVDAIKAKLDASGIGQWKYVPRDEALAELKKRIGLEEIINDLSNNPLPDAFVIEPNDVSSASMKHWQETIRLWPKIAHVQIDSAWLERFNAFINLGQAIVIVLSGLLAIALVAIMFNTIRLQILAQAQAIEVSKLIGATDRFIRRPYCYFGIIQGVIGGAFVAVIISFILDYFAKPIAQLGALYGSTFSLITPSNFEIFSLMGIGGLMGWIGAKLSVSLYLRSIETYK